MTDISKIKTTAELTKSVYGEAENAIKIFKANFLETYNIKLQIFYEIDALDISRSATRNLNIHDIYDSINELIIDDFPCGLKTKSRRMPFIYYKHIFNKLVYDLKIYTLKDISTYLDNNHATVLHSINVAKDLLNNNSDRRFDFVYERIINHLRNKYHYDRNI